MKDVFKFRLALSATLERHHDEYGTQRLLDFFGEKCITYSLERAIKEDKLTPYYYYPIPVYFDEDELEKYNELTEKITDLTERLAVLFENSQQLQKNQQLLEAQNIIHDEKDNDSEKLEKKRGFLKKMFGKNK